MFPFYLGFFHPSPKSHPHCLFLVASAYRGLRKKPAEPYGLPARRDKSQGNVYSWRCWFPRHKIWDPGNLLEKQNKGTIFAFYPKLERGSKKVSLIPRGDRFPPLLPSLITPLQTVILCLFYSWGWGVEEGTEKASDYGGWGADVL